MDKNYKEIELWAGCSIETAVAELLEYREKGKLVCANFNDHMLYSDTVTIEGAYLEITGMTKAEYDKYMEDYIEGIRKREEEHKAKIPELTKEWIEKGHAILDEKYWSYWENIVPIRLGDLYHGFELGCCLDIVKALNDGHSFEDAEKIIDEQGHSGMSYSLVRAMVRDFCDRGKDFASFLAR